MIECSLCGEGAKDEVAMKDFEEKVKRIFGIDFTEWYCKTFMFSHFQGLAELKSMVKKRRPKAYQDLQKFLHPFIHIYEKQIHIPITDLQRLFGFEDQRFKEGKRKNKPRFLKFLEEHLQAAGALPI